MSVSSFAAPRSITVTDENGTYPLTRNEDGRVWGKGDVTVTIVEPSQTITLSAPQSAVRHLHLRWQDGDSPFEGYRFLGDHWERGYGDLEWRGVVPERRMPWYCLAHKQNSTTGMGVTVGANAFCWWQIDNEGINLYLDVSNGGRGVLLGERVLEVATLQHYKGELDESPFDAAFSFCRQLCPSPRLPDHPVYGANDWYYAYGRSTAEGILRDTERTVALSPDGDNRPYSVIDDGWQANRRTPSLTQQAPWDRGNEFFPDMPGLAAAIRNLGARPGIWIRPLGAEPGTPENLLLPTSRTSGANGNVPGLDPSIPENLARIRADMARLNAWGYDLIKHDWTTCDILGFWGFSMNDGLTKDGWHFADRSRTTAEIIRGLYETLREGAGNSLLIGCNTIGHLGAGLFEIQRTGDDTSGREWERTRKMGVNTLAFRMPQHNTFFAADADCVGLTTHVPWHLNQQWLDLLARSGTPLFVSASQDAVGPEQTTALKEAFARAAQSQPAGEPLDWQHTTCPHHWKFGDETVTYHWYNEES
jgi:alpha-galactosidase